MKLQVNIDVPDLERGVRFYTEAFDLHIGRRLGRDCVELLGAAVPLYLLVQAPGSAPFSGASQLRDYRRHWTPVHFDLVVGNLQVAVDRATKAGASLEKPISEHSWGKMALLADPFGHGLCVLELSESGYDAIASEGDAAATGPDESASHHR